MNSRTTFTNNPILNFAKLLGAYTFIAAIILAFILAAGGYGTPKFDSSKLMIPNIIEVFSIIFGFFTSVMVLLFTIGYLFSAVIEKVYKYFGWVSVGETMTLFQYIQNICIVVLAPTIVLGAITAFLYSL